MTLRLFVSLFATAALAAPLAAETAPVADAVQSQTRSTNTSLNGFERFAPAASQRDHRIDYGHWDEALGWFVVPMGPSIRQAPPRADPPLGTRRIYGHESRYRMEGNRVAFSYLSEDIKTALTEYRADLERVGSELDLTGIPRNEQLAFWINLHNVAMIEALANKYPLTEPHEHAFGSNQVMLDDAKLVTIDGVALSPRDIREGIVYANWRDPKVMYGFWRGVIGGPSIQRLAYTGGNVDALLALSAEEFVNSLRGVEEWGDTLRVSPIYEEAARFFFKDDAALRAHLKTFAGDDVRDLLSETERTAYKLFATDIADLARGETMSFAGFVCQQGGELFGPNPPGVNPTNCAAQSFRPVPAIARLMEERAQKLDRARRKGIRTGMVIYGDGGYVEGEEPVEVE